MKKSYILLRHFKAFSNSLKKSFLQGLLSFANLKGCINLNKLQSFVIDNTFGGELCKPFFDEDNYILISNPKSKNDKYGRDKWRFKKRN